MNDAIIALLRRVAVSAVGFVLSWLAIHLGIGVGDKTSATLASFVAVILVAVWGWVAQQLEQKYPWIGHILFLGASRRVTYAKHTR